jgi:hypothetical protein
MFEGLAGIYEIDLPEDVAHFIWFFDNSGYEDLQLPTSNEQQEFTPSLGGSGSEGGGIYAEHGGSEASPVMVGASEAGGGA